jgi:hypothetical protein
VIATARPVSASTAPKTSMVRRGSTVRVRQRALQSSCKSGLSLSAPFASFPACIRYGADYGAPRSATLLASPRTRRRSALMGRPGPDHAAREDDGVALFALRASHCYGRTAATGGRHVVSSGPANSVDFAIALREPDASAYRARPPPLRRLPGRYVAPPDRRLRSRARRRRRRRPRCRRARGVRWSASRRPRNSGGRPS